MARFAPALDLDRSLPVLIAKVGRYPLNHGGLGAIRSLGRLGVPVYAVTEDRFTPAAVSRYLRDRFVWPTTGAEEAEQLVEGLLAIGSRLAWERRPVLLPTDDEAAALVAEHAAVLSERFLLPDMPPDLPRRLADKHGLHQLCRAHGVLSPATALPSSVDELLAAAATIGYPVVLKNAKPWARLQRPAVASTTVVADERELGAIAAGWPSMPSVLVQAYVPPGEGGEEADWIVGVHCAPTTDPLVFTGVKVRSWPAHAGVTTRAFAAPNPQLARLTADFCEAVGFRGIGDLDWRFDRRTGQYMLLDFNPRVGAQFRLFETDAGVDVVRALHLDLSGRPVPAGTQRYDRDLWVENLDLPALLAYRGERRTPRPQHTTTERAWLAVDDPLPAAVAAIRSGGPAAALVAGLLSGGRNRKGPRQVGGRGPLLAGVGGSP